MTSSFFSRIQSTNLPFPFFIAGLSLKSFLPSCSNPVQSPGQADLQGCVQYMGNLSLLRVHPCGRIVVSVPGEFTRWKEN